MCHFSMYRQNSYEHLSPVRLYERIECRSWLSKQQVAWLDLMNDTLLTMSKLLTPKFIAGLIKHYAGCLLQNRAPFLTGCFSGNVALLYKQ